MKQKRGAGRYLQPRALSTRSSDMHPARRGRTRKSPDLTSPANRPTQAGVHARTTSSNICPLHSAHTAAPRAPCPARRRRARSHCGATQRFSGVGRPAHSARRACSARPAAKRRKAGSLFRLDATQLGTRVYPALSQRRLPRRGGARAGKAGSRGPSKASRVLSRARSPTSARRERE